ncbi:hypothetical protein FF098_004425 [Parvularcula flava]|uniref:EF-hand domain-containing protein n=1 Tax=Aquisalinus luteolus TaxID=1566827 RepID=A0A8J3A2R1_9PROT|nr:hypothetical protein [Aquisalinus luteolus]NHK27146.1 hypothetical protein [Aquisalinus luteolus]GGH94539.1 hypothetical protein GCM10011355_08960 [Aquisalinus luteolus]
MKNLYLLCVVASAATLAACATSEPVTVSESGGERSSRGGGGHGRDVFFETYDTNGDNIVTEAEFRQARDEGYARRDANGDGTVSPDEYVGEYEKRLDEQLAAQRDRQLKQAYVRFDALDTDEDGSMTREEFGASGTRMLGSLDDNGDGIVDETDTTQRY